MNKKRIATLLSSNERGLVKLAQLWCSKLRISYYVVVMTSVMGKRVVKMYSLESPVVRGFLGHKSFTYTIETQPEEGFWKIYKINLYGKRGSTTIIKK